MLMIKLPETWLDLEKGMYVYKGAEEITTNISNSRSSPLRGALQELFLFIHVILSMKFKFCRII